MFARPGLCGMGIGRLGLVAASQPSLVSQALAILAKYGSAANLYLPGVGAINGITAGNWLDSAGTTAATVDNPVGRVDNALSGVNLTQATTANKPILRRGLVNQLLWSGDFSNAAWIKQQSSISESPITAPDGGTSYKLTENSAASILHRVEQNCFAVSGSEYTIAVIAKADSRIWMRLYEDSAATGAFFDLSSGLSGSVNAGSVTSYDMGGGWYLIALKYTQTGTLLRYRVSTAIANNSNTYTGDGSSGILLHRAAVYQGALTAQQIINAGGIPLTTTAPASSTSGPFAWQFDGTNDSFASTLTPGNAGFFCSGANFADSDVLRTLLGAGAGGSASSGVWLARAASNALTLQVGNGITRNSVSAAYPVATNAVASAGWDASNMFVGINGAETSGAKSVNCTSANTINIGVLTGTTNPMLGTISGGAIIMPTVLPTASERSILRQLIASLSGVTL